MNEKSKLTQRIEMIWKYKSILVLLFLSSNFSMLQAQNTSGNIQGRVIDSTTGKPLFGVTFIIRSHKLMSMTDENGTFTLAGIPSGEYEAEFVLAGYEKMIKKVKIDAGKTSSVDATLFYKTAAKVVVQTKTDNTAASLLTDRKKSVNVQDAISSEEISRAGDSDAASAAKRITGVSIFDGKYIYIRGLSERYSTVLFNGSNIPSPEPDKKVVPLDIFPAGFLDNMVVIKTYSPDISPEFGVGAVMINPKDFPSERILSVSVDAGYHSQTTFHDFKASKGGKLDFLGYDDGSRALPSEATSQKRITEVSLIHPDGLTNGEVTELSKKFPKFYNERTLKAFPNGGFNIYYGDTFELNGEKKLGIIASALYKEESQNQEKKIKSYDTSGRILTDFNRKQSVFETNLGGLLWANLQLSDDHQFLLTNFYTHQSSDEVARTTGFNDDLSADIDALKIEFVEMGLFFSQLAGKHRFPALNATELNWRVSYALANRNEPGTLTSIYAPNLMFRDNSPMIMRTINDDQTIETGPDIKIPFRQWSNLEANIKLGGSFLYRVRNSDTRRFNFIPAPGAGGSGLTSRPLDESFVDSNISRDNGLYINQITSPNDSYQGTHLDYGGYGMLEFPFFSFLKIVGGVRYEDSNYGISSFDVYIPDKKVKSEILSQNWLPSASLIFSFIENVNIRTSFSRTVSRPDFKEMSPFIFSSVETGDIIVGNPLLKETKINNFDARFEWFPRSGEVLALGGFYKELTDPIEKVERPSSGIMVTYDNIPKAAIYGIEGEVRVGFDFITQALKIFSIAVNAAYIKSLITLPDASIYTNKSRPLQGQSPYIINAALYFTTLDNKLELAALFNIYGERLTSVGIAGLEDTYEQPNNRLDFTGKWNITEKDSVKFNVKNILNSEIKTTQKTWIRSSYREGISAGLGYTHKF